MSFIDNLQEEFKKINKVYRDSSEKKLQIERNEELSLVGRQRQLDELRVWTANEIQTHLSTADRIWREIQREYIAPPGGKVSQETVLATVNLLIASENAATQESINNILRPIEKDVQALQTVYPIAVKMGFVEYFDNTPGRELLLVYKAVQDGMKIAERTYNSLVHESRFGDDSNGIDRGYLQNVLIGKLKEVKENVDTLWALTE